MDIDDFNVFDVKKNDLDNFGGPNVKEQGLQILNSGHIIQVGVISRNVIEGVCIQSSHPSDTPHKITINTSALWKDWKFSCSCKAGLSQRCKHIYGVLCYIERFKKVEVLTCTQKQQRWNQASKEVANSVLEPSKIIDLPEVKKKNVQLDLLPEEKKLFTQVLFGAKNSAVSKFMTNYMNRKRESVKESVVTEAPIGIAAPIDEANEIQVELVDPSKKDTIEYYLNELFATHDLKQKIHFFDRESTPMHVIELYNKWICIDNRAAVAVHINTLRQDGNFERKKDKRMRIKTEDSYQLFTFFTNKKRTDDELKRKAVSYLKKKENAKSVKSEKNQKQIAFELYEKVSGEKVEKVGLLINPSCPWLCGSPDGLCLKNNTLLKIKYLIDTEKEGLTAMMGKLPFLKFDVDSLGNKVCELRTKHTYYAELQQNMALLGCHHSDFILLHSDGTNCTIEVRPDSTFVSKILTTLKAIYMRYFLNFIFENMLTDADKLTLKKV